MTRKNVSGPARDRTRSLGVSSRPRCRLRYTALLLPGALRDGLHPKYLLASDLGRNREVGSHGHHLEASGLFYVFLPLSTPCCLILLPHFMHFQCSHWLFPPDIAPGLSGLPSILDTVFCCYVCTPTLRRKPLTCQSLFQVQYNVIFN